MVVFRAFAGGATAAGAAAPQGAGAARRGLSLVKGTIYF